MSINDKKAITTFLLLFSVLGTLAFLGGKEANESTLKQTLDYNSKLTCTVKDKSQYGSLSGKHHNNYNIYYTLICQSDRGELYQRDVSYLTWYQAKTNKTLYFNAKDSKPSFWVYFFTITIALIFSALLTAIFTNE